MSARRRGCIAAVLVATLAFAALAYVVQRPSYEAALADYAALTRDAG